MKKNGKQIQNITVMNCIIENSYILYRLMETNPTFLAHSASSKR